MDRIRRLKLLSQQVYNRLSRRDDPSKENIQLTSHIKTEKKSITWTVENVSLCPLNVGEYLESPIFCTGVTDVTNWCLRFYPKGNLPSEPSNAGLCLCKLTPSTRNMVHVVFYRKHGTLNKNVISFEKHIFEETEEIGTDEFINLEQLETMESVTIVCNMEVGYLADETDDCGNKITGSSGISCGCTLSSDLKKLHDNGKFADAVLQVDKQEFPVHKAILAARSNVFAKMFEHGMKEGTTGTVTIKDIEPFIINNVLQHIYTGKVDDMTADKAIQLYSVADMYELFQLKKECTSLILENISVDNVCRIAILADIYSASELQNATNFYFRNYSYHIFEKGEWKALVTDRPLLASKIVKSVVSDYKTKCSARKSEA